MNKKLVGFGGLALLCTNVIAQQVVQNDSISVQQLDEVVVSDSRFKLKRENSGKTVIKISAEELERNQGRSVAEIINTKSGLEVNGSRSYAGQNISVYARGGNNRQVLVIIDGIQVSDPSNVSAEYDLRLLNTSQIESIEIIKGASSTLYGNSAATAVINITTKNAKEDGLALDVLSSVGTNQPENDQNYNISDFSNTVTITAKEGDLTVLASGGHQYTDGLSAAVGEEADDFSRIDGTVKIGYRFSNKLDLTASAFYNKLNAEYDNGFPIEDADFYYKGEQSRFGLAGTYFYKNGEIHANTAFNQINREFVSNFPSAYDSESLVFDVFNKYTFNKNLHTVLGVNYVDGKTLFDEEKNANNFDPYANVVYVSDFGLNLNIGARLNNHSEYGSNLIYNINPSYRVRVNDGYIKVMGSYATSYIAPNLSQLYGPYGANPDLEPEEDTTIEGGLEVKFSDWLRLSGIYFNRKEEGRIGYVTINPETFESQYRNILEDVNLSGIEIELQAKPIKNMDVSANYTLTEAEEDLALRIPKNKINATVGYTFGNKTYASVMYQNVSSRTDTDFITYSTVDLEPFSLVDLYLKHEVCDQFSFFISVNNAWLNVWFGS